MRGEPHEGGPLMRFEVSEGPRSGESFEVGTHRMIIGSEDDCDFPVHDPDVSGEHLSLKTLDGHAEVHDLGSRTGTFVNDNKITAPALVGPGDHVRIGHVVMTVIRVPEAEEEATPEVAEPVAAGPAVTEPSARAVTEPGGPPAPPPPAKERRMTLPPRGWLIAIGAVGALVIIGIVLVVAGVFSSGNGALTNSQIIAKDKPSTVMIFTRGAAGSPVVALSNGELVGGGSGWVYDASRGLIVTNAHVVTGGATVQVGFDSSNLTDATIVGVDLGDDIAVLKVPPAVLTGLTTMERANPSSVKQGDAAFALGYPGNSTTSTNFLKTPFQLTQGTISAISGVRADVSTDMIHLPNNTNAIVLQSDLYQTDAAINAGNSGGPLVNNHGQLVGMNVAGSSTAQSQGYAIPITKLNSVVPKLAGGTSIGWPGFGATAISPALAKSWDIPGGMLIMSVTKDTPADQAGLTTVVADVFKTGHLILLYRVNGQDVYNAQQYVDVMKQFQSGQRITLHLAVIGVDGVVHQTGTKALDFP